MSSSSQSKHVNNMIKGSRKTPKMKKGNPPSKTSRSGNGSRVR